MINKCLRKYTIILASCAVLITAGGEALGAVLMQMMAGKSVTQKDFLLRAGTKGLLYGLAAGCFVWLSIMIRQRKRKITCRPAKGSAAGVKLISGLLIFLCWIPCWIAYYPAIYSYDGEPQLIQYTTRAFDNHHPVFHTLIMGWCYDLGNWVSGFLPRRLDGMAIYAVLQMVFLCYAFASVISMAYRRGAGKISIALLTAWFAFFPVHPLMAISTTKDTPYAACLVLFVTALSAVLYEGNGGFPLSGRRIAGDYICLVISGTLMMMFRKNGLYLVTGTVLMILLVMMVRWISGRRVRGSHNAAEKMSVSTWSADGALAEKSSTWNADEAPGRELSLRDAEEAPGEELPTWNGGRLTDRKIAGLLLTCILVIVLGIAADKALVYATGAVQGESAEALSIPLQQLARAYKSHTDDFSQEDLEEIAQYESVTGLNNYRPFITDAVKQGFENEHFREDPMGFFRIWARYGKKYPGSYLTAVLYHTLGAWYPDDVSHTLVYADWWRDRVGYLITNAIPVFAQRYVVEENLWPACRAFYEAIATECRYRSWVPLRILFSPFLYCAATFLLMLAGALQALRRPMWTNDDVSDSAEYIPAAPVPQTDLRDDPWMMPDARLLILMTPLFVHYLMILAGPCVIARYVYPLMAALPCVGVKKVTEGRFI